MPHIDRQFDYLTRQKGLSDQEAMNAFLERYMYRHGKQRCRKCGEIKLLDEFPIARQCMSGHSRKCKACVAVHSRIWRKTEAGKVAEQKKEKKRLIHPGRRRYKQFLFLQSRVGPIECADRYQEWKVIHASLMEEFDHACCYCGSPDDLTIDHVDPVCKGGGNTLNNLAPACFLCNSTKSGRSIEDFIGAEKALQIREKLQRVASRFRSVN